MNTPAHVVFSLGILGWRNASGYAIAIALGALLPDLPMILFYGIQKLQGVPERIIWNLNYFLPVWQNWFDITNSIPLFILGTVILFFMGKKHWSLFFASATIHCILDFFVHRDDSHRHFFPFSDYRFISPVSYWDPAYYGNIVSLVEIFLFVIMAVMLWIVEKNKTGHYFKLSSLRTTILVTSVIYSGFFIFVVTTWMQEL